MPTSLRPLKESAQLMTVRELSRYLRIHPATLYRLAKTRQLPGFKIGDSWRFDPERVSRWLNEHRQKGDDAK